MLVSVVAFSNCDLQISYLIARRKESSTNFETSILKNPHPYSSRSLCSYTLCRVVFALVIDVYWVESFAFFGLIPGDLYLEAVSKSRKES